jgi:hypothetical protein
MFVLVPYKEHTHKTLESFLPASFENPPASSLSQQQQLSDRTDIMAPFGKLYTSKVFHSRYTLHSL